MPIITPVALEADAVQPQCLDNQFVSEPVLNHMLAGPTQLTYEHPDVQSRRMGDTKVEFLRSLLYSSQVIVNRAYFSNSHYLIQQKHKHRSALAELINTRAIVPYLDKGHSFSDASGDFTTLAAQDADLAFYALIDETRAAFLRFHEDDTINHQQTLRLPTEFANFCQGTLAHNLYEEELIRPVATRLYAGLAPDPSQSLPQDVYERFLSHVAELSRFSCETSLQLARERKHLGRDHIYRSFFIEQGLDQPGNTPAGRFRRDVIADPARHMLKRLVDLKYNSNLPDLLERYTLTPATLPGRSSLPFQAGDTPLHQASSNQLVQQLATLRQLTREFAPPVVLPRLRNLELEDLFQIRELPEWRVFRIRQKDLLTAPPEALLARFESYGASLQAFQHRLEQWSLSRGHEANLVRKVSGVAFNLVVQFGAAVLNAHIGQHGNVPEKLALQAAVSTLASTLPEEAKNCCIKLSVQVYDLRAHLPNDEHSYEFELKRAQTTRRAEILDLISEIQQSTLIQQGEQTPLAEQSRN